MKDADYYAENTEEFELLDDAQQEAVFNGETIETGDTSEANEEPVETESTSDTKAGEEVSETPPAESDNTNETELTLLAKDGKNTIPYSQLEEARARVLELEGFSGQQTKMIEDLQAAKIQDEETGGTGAQEAVIEEYEGDYPEIAEEMKPYIQKMIDDGVKAGVEAVEQRFNERVAPLQETTQEAANKTREDAILAAHPDAIDVYQSQELKDWIAAQPSFVQEQYSSVLQASTAEQMNELFSAYKDATNFGTKEPEAESITDKAKGIIAKTEKKPPASLSDIPASTAGTLDESEAMLEMTPSQLESKFDGKSSEQIMALMSKLV